MISKMLRRAAKQLAAMLYFSALIIAGGCGESGPPLVPVGGTVKLDGKPLAEAEMTFVPDAGNKHITPGNAFTADDGTYKVRYQGKFGLAEGKYVVTVKKNVIADKSKVPDAMKDDPAQLEMLGLTKPSLNKKYSAPDASPFTIEVTGDGKPHDLELDSKGR